MRRLFHKLFAQEIRCRWCNKWIWRWQLVKDSDGSYNVMHGNCLAEYHDALGAM